MEIRSVKEQELGELLDLLRAKAEFDGCLDSLVATVESLRHAIFSETPMARALVAVEDGKLVGMATFYSIFSTFIAKPGLWMDDLYIYETYRGRGIGKALVVQLCAIAQESGCGRVDWIVSKSNDAGKAFYAGIGATISDSAQLVRLNESAIAQLAVAKNDC